MEGNVEKISQKIKQKTKRWKREVKKTKESVQKVYYPNEILKKRKQGRCGEWWGGGGEINKKSKSSTKSRKCLGTKGPELTD